MLMLLVENTVAEAAAAADRPKSLLRKQRTCSSLDFLVLAVAAAGVLLL